MLDPVTAAVVGLTGLSVIRGEQSRKEQKRATRAQQRIQERRNQRQRIQQVRESVIASAQIQQAGATQGIPQASAVKGGVAGVQTQAATNISFINQIESLQQNIQRNLERARTFAGQARTLGQAAEFASGFTAPSPNTKDTV